MERDLEHLSLNEDGTERLRNTTCAICIGLLVEPVYTECKHVFCFSCLESYLDQIAVGEHRKCPMCRGKLSATFKPVIDKVLEAKIIKQHKQEYETLLKKIVEVRKKDTEFIKLKLIYGNLHKLVANPRKSKNSPAEENKHKWTMFVKTLDFDCSKIIRKVTYGLHPSFGAPQVEVKTSPFELTKIGWGTFDIPIKIEFCSWLKLKPVELNHYLSFNNHRESNVHIIKLTKEVFEKNKLLLK
jgi:transcription initiation factor IIF auxiliary subunit